MPISSSTLAITWPAPRTSGYSRELAKVEAGGSAREQNSVSEPALGARRTVGDPAANLLDLVANRFVVDLGSRAADAEPLRARQRDLGSHLDVKLEAERLPLLELEIVDVRLRRDLELSRSRTS